MRTTPRLEEPMDNFRGWRKAGRTLGDVLAQHSGIVPGFLTIRLAAAFAVLVSHSFPLTGVSSDPLQLLTRDQTTLGGLAVLTFFIVSGFVVTPSFLSSASLLHYAVNRALRIFPALLVVVTLSAMCLGPLVTTKPWIHYFTSSEFPEYFLNAGLMLRTPLPGVFEALPYAKVVNGSLWTLRYEAACYVLLVLLAYTTGLRHTLVILSVAFCSCVLWRWLPGHLPASLMSFDTVTFLNFWAYFAAGAAMYLLRGWVFLDWRIAVVALGASVLAIRGGSFQLMLPIVGAYLVIYLGMRMQDPAFLRGRDYSYGFYLYAFPVQQLLVHAMPTHAVWWLNVALAAPLTLVCAWLSWHLVEKRMLSFKFRPRQVADGAYRE